MSAIFWEHKNGSLVFSVDADGGNFRESQDVIVSIAPELGKDVVDELRRGQTPYASRDWVVLTKYGVLSSWQVKEPFAESSNPMLVIHHAWLTIMWVTKSWTDSERKAMFEALHDQLEVW